ncbi:MAG: fumarylacetoacetate hydrolase family protein [Fervidicoccaceae archaeon]
MRLVTYMVWPSLEPRYGLLAGEGKIVDLQKLLEVVLVEKYDFTRENSRSFVRSVFDGGSRFVIQRISFLRELINNAVKGLNIDDEELVKEGLIKYVDEVKFLPPVFDPPKVIGIGQNFEEYRIMLKYPKPEVPLFFFKPSNTLIGHKDVVIIPRGGKWPGTASRIVFHEYELAIIIGKRAKNVEKEKAFNYVYGFTIFSDITAHDIEMIQPGFVLYQQRAKAFDTFSPMGPWIVTMDEIREKGVNIYNLKMARKRNGVVEGESNTKNMVYKIEEIIEFLSEIMTLEPGDVISLGSPPAGPPQGLQPGDVIEAEIEHIGSLVNYVK